MKNILFSTTFGWNSGDNFIVKGILNILKEKEFNPIIYNRHPDLKWSEKDNSLRHKGHDLDSIDYFIQAGSPEWNSPSLDPLFEKLVDSNIRCSFIGIGQGSHVSGNLEKIMENNTDLIISRDTHAHQHTQRFGSKILPCPAFFAAEPKPRNKKEKLGLMFMTNITPNNQVSTACKNKMIEHYKNLTQKYDCEFICHYIDELLEIKNHFPDHKTHYSYDFNDYDKIYDRFDLTVGPRLHGCVLGAALGIPGIMIIDHAGENARRISGSQPFGFTLCNENCDDLTKMVDDIDITSESERLIKLREDTHKTYSELLESII